MWTKRFGCNPPPHPQVEGQPNVLVTWVTGEAATAADGKTLGEIIDTFASLIR